MSLETLRTRLPDTAKDIRLNLGSILNENGADELNTRQQYSIALACAYATQQKDVIQALQAEAEQHLSESDITAAKSAATIMAMNNVYYRFVHLASDQAFTSMPAKLRMNVIANPGVAKADFELNSLAVSAINGCGMCIDSHARTLAKEGVSKTAIQSAVRIAAIINATSQAIETA